MDQAHGKVRRGRVAGAVLLGCLAGACSGSDSDAEPGAPAFAHLPYAQSVVSFTPGEGSGFGEDELPSVVLGPPDGKGESAGSLDVLSLGAGGEIVLAFGERTLVDGPGPDLVVFENAFFAGGDPTMSFAEPGEVAVSADGEEFVAFDCQSDGDETGRFPGCAGATPTLAYDPEEVIPLVPELTGGDAFDLEAIGVSEARYVRIRDVSKAGAAPIAGFDLDAVGLVNTLE